MALDYGLYTAIRGKDNWQQRRADKAMNLQLIERQNQIADEQTKKRVESEQYLNKYLSELQNMDVLTQDKERVAAAEREARKSIINGIKSYNGDLSRYMSSGGLSDLNDYRNNLMNSEAVKNAAENKVALKNYLESQNKGLYIKKVNTPTAKKDKDGKVMKDDNGNPIMEMRRTNWEDHFEAFKRGDIKRLDWRGAEKKVSASPWRFKQTYKDALYPGSKDNIVTGSNVYDSMVMDGASDEQARDIALNYQNMYKQTGNAWKWNARSAEETALLQAKKAKASGAGRGSSDYVLDQLRPQFTSAKNNTQIPLSKKGSDFFDGVLNISYDKDSNRGIWRNPNTAAIDLNGQPLDLAKAWDTKFLGKIMKYDGQPYYMIQTVYDADDSSKGTPSAEGAFEINQNNPKKGYSNTWTYTNNASETLRMGGDDVDGQEAWSGIALVKANELFDNRLMDEYDKAINVRQGPQVKGASQYTSDKQQQIQAAYQYFANKNATPEQVNQFLSQY